MAVNKNTGLDLLMNRTDADELFLSDDDTWPLTKNALLLHTGFRWPHSMVCWGKSRLDRVSSTHAAWSWPRGVVLHQTRWLVDQVGGMDEAFGPGGHEHVEFSRRIHQHGLTPVPNLSPSEYALDNGKGALRHWHAEDAPLRRELLSERQQRRKHLTSVRREPGDWEFIEAVMAGRNGDTSFVSYEPNENGRASATLYQNQ